MNAERVLLVVTPSVSEGELERAVPASGLRGSNLKVVVPALARSALAYWFSDEGGIVAARESAETAARMAGREAATVQAGTGDADPVLAVKDAVATFAPDRVILVHRVDRTGYRERDLDDLEAELHRPVDDRLVAT